MLKMESCLVLGQPPAMQRWVAGQSMGRAELGMCLMYRADMKQESEVLTDSPCLLIFESTEALLTTK